MKKYLLLLLLSLSLGLQAQVSKFVAAGRQGSIGSSTVVPGPDYSSLDGYFTYFAPVTPTSVFQNTTRTLPAVNGSVSKAINERKQNKHLIWGSSEARKGYLNTKYGMNSNRDYPMYLFPAGDIPHIHYTNYLDMVMRNQTITPIVGPVTKHFLVRSRRGVNFEALSTAGQVALKDFSTTMQVGSSTNFFVTVTGSTLLPEDVWTLATVVLDGANSKLFYNGIQQGSTINVNSGTVSDFGHGTDSHIYEMDLAFDGLNDFAMSNAQVLDLANAVNAIVPLGVLPSGLPYARNVNVVFDGTDTFNCTFTYVAGSGGIAIDPTKTEYRWIHNDFGTTGGNGLNGLDIVKTVFNHGASSLKRSDFPSYFRPASIGVPNNANIACEVKVYDLNGRTSGWIPCRSRYTPDATTGSPDGTYAPVATAGVINDALKTAIDITYSAALNTGTGLYTDFTVTVDGVDSPVTSISFQSSTVLRVNHTITPTNLSEVIVRLRQTATNPLKGANGKTCESHVAGSLDGPFYRIVNNILGPQVVKANLISFGANSTSSTGWININDPSWNTTGVKSSNMNNITGVASGIGLEVTDGFDRANDTNTATTPQTSSDVPDTNITARVQGTEGGGNVSTIKLYGFTQDKLVDVELYFYKDSGYMPGGSGNVTFIDKTNSDVVSIPNNQNLQKVVKTGMVANASGQVFFEIRGTSAGTCVGLAAIIFTKYP